MLTWRMAIIATEGRVQPHSGSAVERFFEKEDYLIARAQLWAANRVTWCTMNLNTRTLTGCGWCRPYQYNGRKQARGACESPELEIRELTQSKHIYYKHTGHQANSETIYSNKSSKFALSRQECWSIWRLSAQGDRIFKNVRSKNVLDVKIYIRYVFQDKLDSCTHM